MRVKLLLFAVLRDRAGTAALELDLPAGATLADVLAEALVARPALGPLPPGVRMARNLDFAGLDEPVADGDELALLPPVSGG